jgi:acyl-CoA synthetase (AMP-forming)/AMP-acid ligase II
MIFRGRVAEVPSIPTPEFLLSGASEYPDRTALIEGPSGRTITYGELGVQVSAAAAGLIARGFEPGDVFAMLSPNLPDYAVALLGVLSAGGVATTMNPLYTVEEIAHQLEDAGAKYLLTIPAFASKATEVGGRHPLKEIFVFGEAPGATSFASLLTHNAAAPLPKFDPRTHTAVLPYSSGTTGSPKGVVLTHYNLNAGVLAANLEFPRGNRTTGIAALPFFHIAGMVCILMAGLRNGVTLVTLPRFDIESFCKTIQDYRIETASCVPPIIGALLKHPAVSNYDLSSLQYIGCGAAPLGGELQRAASSKFNAPVVQGYGMTEAAGLTHGNAEWDGSRVPGSVGPCAANIETKLVDISTGEELGRGQNGELWLRGPQVMSGYLNKPDITRSCLDREGWYHTGDVAYADENGCFYIVDRLKELIKYNAYQVAPAELEAVLMTHPAIADAAVVPSPDEDAGEVPKAFVVLREAIAPEGILEYVAARVAPYKKIRRIEILDQIPKSASGKILRYVLVRRERAKACPTQAAVE